MHHLFTIPCIHFEKSKNIVYYTILVAYLCSVLYIIIMRMQICDRYHVGRLTTTAKQMYRYTLGHIDISVKHVQYVILLFAKLQEKDVIQ